MPFGVNFFDIYKRQCYNKCQYLTPLNVKFTLYTLTITRIIVK